MADTDAEQEAAERNNALIRKCVDYHGPAIIDLQNFRLFRGSGRAAHLRKQMFLQPHSSYLRHMKTPLMQICGGGGSGGGDPIASEVYVTQLAHTSRAKNSASSIHCLSWTPGGRRLITGNHEGEITLWDGIHFTYELMMSAHDASFRSMTWSHHRNYLLTSDAAGNIKYWSPSIAPVQSIDSHAGQAIHELSFSPSDTKFCSGGDDSTVRVWDWVTHREERVIEGHGWDVKSVQWHPRSSLIASGSKDNLTKLWDPRMGTCLSTLYGHKNTVTKVAWNDNGNWLLTASRDQLIKLYDLRSMRELFSFKGHYKEVTSLAWHPLYESVFVSGGMDGTLLFWNVGAKGSDEAVARVPFAHDMAVWDMAWHPAGHMLATGSNDRQTKFWARNRLGTTTHALQEEAVAASTSQQHEIITEEMELGNHVGIVIGKKGQTIISMQRATGTSMRVDQARRTLLIQGTAKQIATVKRRVGALLERMDSEDHNRGGGPRDPNMPY